MKEATGTEQPPAARRVGSLIRRFPIRVVDISAAGCLLESALPVEPGTVAMLALQIAGRRYVDPVRITRVVRLSGGIWAYRFAVDLLELPPSAKTLRRLALLERAELFAPGSRVSSQRNAEASSR